MRRKFVVGCGAAVLLAILAIGFWPRPSVNVLLITLDTTRADRLGCYGYASARTPALDALASAGVVCERAVTVAPLTLPAHTSLFTGLYPAETGIRSNGRGRLADTIPTLAEVLKRQGYDTGAFISSFVLDAKFGLARGFQKYDDDITASAAGGEHAHRERDGAAVVDAALEWLGARPAKPFFCWVHLFDPHAPYLSHADLFADEFADRPYDAEIAYVDRQVARLVDFLKTNGLDSRTLVVVVGDHGEGLREHQEPKHGMTLYETVLHVPLILRQTGALPFGLRIPDCISLVDVSPTILDLARIKDPRTTTGQSFSSQLRGGTPTASICYAATDEPFLNNGWSSLRSVRNGSWKYIRTTKPELYDLAADPTELNNLADAQPEKLQEMEIQLSDLEARLVLQSTAKVQLRPHEKRALESLGYLGGKTPEKTKGTGQELADVKDMLPFEMLVDDAADEIARGQFEPSVTRLSEIVQRYPGYSKANCFLATALRRQRQYDEAAETLQRFLKVSPNAVEAHYGLATVFLEEGRDEMAAAELQRILEIDPEYADAHYELGLMDMRQGNSDAALDRFDAVLDIDHCNGAAYAERATLLVGMGRIRDALADYDQALKYSPSSPTLHHNLGIVLQGAERHEEALTHLRRAVELDPNRADFQYSLGAILMDQGQFSLAVAPLAKAIELDPGLTQAQIRLEQARNAPSDSSTRKSRDESSLPPDRN
jgi:arylsulfatase A-like enzyme/tetratricopeptide (TPR) repeat protein